MDRRFRLLWLGESTSALGSSIASVALPLVALQTLHATALEVSLLSAAAWLPWLLIGLAAGVWVDRLRRRRVMLAADLAQLALFGVVPLAAWTGGLSVPLLLVIALLGGVGEVFFSTAYRAFLPSIVAAEDRARANSRLQGSESVAQVAGPGVAGLLAHAFGAVTGVLVNALSFAVSFACLTGIPDDRPHGGDRRHLLTEVREGLRFVRHDGYLRTYMLFGGASNLALCGYQAILVTFLVREVRLDSGTVGLLLALGQLGGVTGAFTAPRVAARIGTARFVIASKFVMALGALLVPLASVHPAFLVAGVAVVAGTAVGGNVVNATFVQGYCPQPLYGRVSSSMQVVNLGFIPIGAVLGGALATALGLQAAMWVMTALLLPAATVLLTGPLRHDRDLPTQEAVPTLRA